MPAGNFADLIISKLSAAIGTEGKDYTSSTPGDANKAIAEACTEYITDNTSITIAYDGKIPGSPPTPDPIIADKCPVKGTVAPPGGTDFGTWIKSLETNIVKAFDVDKGTAGIEPVSTTKAFLSGLDANQEKLKELHKDNLDNPQKAVWTEICTWILTWLNSIITPSYPAQNKDSKSTGKATPTKITVK